VFQQAHRPMVLYEVIAVGCATALAAVLGVWPFLLRQRALEARAERDQLAGTLAQLQRLEEVADRIGLATGQWQTAQEHANTAVAAAREIAGRLTEEQRAFRDLLQQGQAARIQHLELEATKLRRAEDDWLQVAVRILDHVYALYLAAARSGQPHLAEQIGAFQNACRDAARRVGLVAHAAAPGTAYDPQAHQLADPNAALPEEPTVAGTIGPGYLFQGQLLRRAVVVVQPRATLDRALPPVSGEGVAFSSDSGAAPAEGEKPAGSWPQTAPDTAAGGAAAASGDSEPLTTSFTTGRPDDLPAGGA
jgi:molecular chaperone GrpE (heat shock protein)